MAEITDINELSREMVEDFLEELRDKQLEVHDREKMRASGRTRETFTVLMEKDKGTLFGPAHIRQLEQGRRPGNMPPVSSILEWIRNKGISTENPTSLAWAIATKIKNEGTRRWRGEQRKPSGIVSDVFDEKEFKDFVERMGDVYGKFAATYLSDELKELNDAG